MCVCVCVCMCSCVPARRIYLYTIIYNIIMYGHNAYYTRSRTDNRAMHQSGSDTAAERRRSSTCPTTENNNFFFSFLRFLFLLIFPFQRRPRRINYNRDPVKSSLGELFIDPACPNGRAREHWTYIKIWLCPPPPPPYCLWYNIL